MPGTDGKDDEPRPGYIPRPPSPEDVDRVSGQQGLITDEWTGPAPAPPKPRPEAERSWPPDDDPS